MEEEIVEHIVTLCIVTMVVGIPMLGLTLRFSLKPLVDAFIRLREAQLGASDSARLRERVAHLEHVLESHGLMDARQPMVPRHGSVEQLPANVPLKDRERV